LVRACRDRGDVARCHEDGPARRGDPDEGPCWRAESARAHLDPTDDLSRDPRWSGADEGRAQVDARPLDRCDCDAVEGDRILPEVGRYLGQAVEWRVPGHEGLEEPDRLAGRGRELLELAEQGRWREDGPSDPC